MQTKTSTPAEVFFSFEFLRSMAKPQQMSLIDINSHNLLKQLVECLIRVSHQQCPLVRIVMIEIGNDLNCHVSLS